MTLEETAQAWGLSVVRTTLLLRKYWRHIKNCKPRKVIMTDWFIPEGTPRPEPKKRGKSSRVFKRNAKTKTELPERMIDDMEDDFLNDIFGH